MEEDGHERANILVRERKYGRELPLLGFQSVSFRSNIQFLLGPYNS